MEPKEYLSGMFGSPCACEMRGRPPVQGIAKQTDGPRKNVPSINVSRSLTLLSKHSLWRLYRSEY
jgi:hypothetical protein